MIGTLLLASLSAQGFTLGTQDPNETGFTGSSVTVTVSTAHCPANIMDLVDNAMALWNSVPRSRLHLERSGSEGTETPSQNWSRSFSEQLLINCDPAFSTTTSADGNFVAGLTKAYQDSNHNITQSGIVLNFESGKNANIGNASDDVKTIIIAHEMGHAIGFGHSQDNDALMYYDGSYKQTLSLSFDDETGLVYLYPRDEWTGKDPLLGGCGLMNSRIPPRGPGWPLALASILAPLAMWSFGRRRSKVLNRTSGADGPWRAPSPR